MGAFNIEVLRTVAQMRAWASGERGAGRTVGLVPTMGALHEGHLSLIRSARAECQSVVVSIFVNPTQFGPREDFDRYPRTPEQDRALAASAGAHATFEPVVEEMYPEGFSTYVVQERLAECWEGAVRPGHFRGVCTVCLKLFNIVQPHVAYFGQKDYQQSVVVRRMVRDLNLPLTVRVLPTVREADGLAMSSRNRYLNPQEREQARCLSRALRQAERLFRRGERRAQVLVEAMADEIGRAPLARIDYVEIVHPETLESLQEAAPGSVALVAVRIGSTRLIDNTILGT